VLLTLSAPSDDNFTTVPSQIVAKSRQKAAADRPVVLAIAGSDSSGGAGIQADLRAIAACGAHGLSAITAVTAQTARQVHIIHRVPMAVLRAQLDAAADGFDIAAIKIGMLGSSAAIRLVADFVRRQRRPTVLDPVLVSSSGTRLLPASGLAALREELIPLATVLTPNLPEAAALLGRALDDSDAADAARALRRLGSSAVLLKGGHGRTDPVRDYLAYADEVASFSHRRQPIQARGTGCTLAAAIAAGLAAGLDTMSAVRQAERYLQRALRRGYRVDGGDTRVLASS